MAILSVEAKAKVSQRITEIEKRTSGELVVLVAARSSQYSDVRALFSIVLCSALSALFYLAVPQLPGLYVFAGQPFITLGLWWLLGWGPLLRLITPRARVDQAVQARAKALFLDHGVTETTGRSGVLLYISECEHAVHLLADAGIHACVGQAHWADVVNRLVTDLKAGRAEAGLLKAVDAIGARLEQHFPPEPGQKNELSDEVKRVNI